MADNKKVAVFDAKAMLEKHAKAGTKIKYTDRKKVEVIVDTKHYKKGMILEPHLIKAEALIEQGIAEEVKK